MRIFICSTGGDLRAERDAVTAAIHRLRLRHESMEIFGADPAEPVETCIKRVRQSDVLVVIVAHMYGSVVRGRRISFFQMEYEEGFGAGKPCLVYMRDMNQPVLPQHYEREPEKIALLDKWKKVLHARHTVAHSLPIGSWPVR